MKKQASPDRRSYRQFCGLAKALDMVGERWTLLIVRNLVLGPLRYSDLMRGLPGITTNLLAKRLKEMEESGLIEHVAERQAYQLTTFGQRLEPAIHALGSWGWQLMGAPKRGELRSFDFLAVALRRRYKGNAVLRAEVVADGIPYRLTLTKKRATVGRGDMPSPDVRLMGSGSDLATLFLTDGPKLRLPHGVTAEGSEEKVRALLAAFAAGDELG